MGEPAELHIKKLDKSVQLTMTFISDDEALQVYKAIINGLKNGKLTLSMPVQKEHPQ